MPGGRRKVRKMGEPIYEKLAPNEIFILEKVGDVITYVVNKNGRAYYKKARLVENLDGSNS